MAEYLVFPELERSGRLGNQLWQIASTIGLAHRHGLRPLFPEEWSYRRFFSVPDAYFAPRNLLPSVNGIHPGALPDLGHLNPATRVYLQDLSFWAEVQDEVRAAFAPSQQARELLSWTLAEPPQSRDLALHVRRGDNLVQQDYYPVASLDFWLRAAKMYPDRLVRMFSDDRPWCQNVLGPALHRPWSLEGVGLPRLKEHQPGYWTEAVTDWIDLFYLARSSKRAFVIANSSFGWWGAWLSGSDEVTIQDPFYGPRLDIRRGGYVDESLMMPASWGRLPL